MIENTFYTLKKNPKIFIIFTVATLLTLLFTLYPTLESMQDIPSIRTMDSSEFLSFMTECLIIAGIMFLVSLISPFCIPTFGNVIYRMCACKLEEGWFNIGVTRWYTGKLGKGRFSISVVPGWWKVKVFALILMGVLILVSLLMLIIRIIFSNAVILCTMLIYIIAVVVSVYVIISLTAIMAEEELSVALRNTFIVGSKYFFRFLGVFILAYIPLFIGIIILSLFSTNEMAATGEIRLGFWITCGVIGIYILFASAFVCTYSMNQYLQEKSFL